MKKYLIILIFTIIQLSLSAQQKSTKKVVLDLFVSVDYVTVLPQKQYYHEVPGFAFFTYTVKGKSGLGLGARMNINNEKRSKPFVGIILVDKGLRIYTVGNTDSGLIEGSSNYYSIYLCLPIGISFDLSKKINPFYLNFTLSPDIMINKLNNLNRFNGSFMVGAGKRLKISNLRHLVVESNLKIPISSYGYIGVIPIEDIKYKPYSIGINFGISL